MKLSVGVALVVASAVHVGDDTATERSVGRFFVSLPSGLHGIFSAVLHLGTWWGVGLVVAPALIAHRRRLALVIGLAGAVTWFLGRLVGFLTIGQGVGDGIVAVVNGTGPYPAVHLGVIAAVVLTASPFLARPTRRLGQALLTALVLGVLYRGVGNVNDVFAAVVLAWTVAAGLHLVFGSPAGRPTTAQVAASLAELGFPVERVQLAPVQQRGFTLMIVETATGEMLPVKVYGRDAADTRLVAKAWRFLAYKDSGPTLTITRLQQVEHEALCLFAAREAGAHVPEVIVVGMAGPSAAILMTRLPPTAAPLSADDPDINGQLQGVWRDVARLRASRLAHGALDLDHLASTSTFTVIDDFAAASVSAPMSRLDQDVAQLLVASAGLVGENEATRTAVIGIGPEVVGDALRYVQKPALTPANRRAVRNDKQLLDRLGATVAAATEREPVTAIELRRVKPLSIVMFVALVFAIWVILGQVGSVGGLIDTLKTAEWPWLAVGFGLAQTTSVAFAFTTIGSVPQPVALLPATLLQMAVSFTNMVAMSSAASMIMNIRFLQKQGVETGAATSSGVLVGLSGTVAQFCLFVVTAFAVGRQASISQLGGSGGGAKKVVLAAVFAVAVAVGIAMSIPRLRRVAFDKVWPQVIGALRNIWGILTTPRQLFTVLGGAFAAQLLYSLCLLSCLYAYGGRLSLGEIIFVNTSASFLASFAPIPGGMGVAEATLVAGLTTFGISAEVAAATVVTHRLFTTYLPPIWGSYATKRLVRDGYL